MFGHIRAKEDVIGGAVVGNTDRQAGVPPGHPQRSFHRNQLSRLVDVQHISETINNSLFIAKKAFRVPSFNVAFLWGFMVLVCVRFANKSLARNAGMEVVRIFFVNANSRNLRQFC